MVHSKRAAMVLLVIIFFLSCGKQSAIAKTVDLNLNIYNCSWDTVLEAEEGEPPFFSLRDFAQIVGAEVTWHEATGVVSYVYGNRGFFFHPQSKVAYVAVYQDENMTVQKIDLNGDIYQKNGVNYASLQFLAYLEIDGYWNEDFSALSLLLNPQFYLDNQVCWNVEAVYKSCFPTILEAMADELHCIGTYSTKFNPGDKARSKNLALAAEAIDGYCWDSDKIFSFNQVVGPRTPQKGYEKAIIFVDKEKVADYGGGICQVSSTLYNACLNARLTVIERYSHSLGVDYVPPGLDATVSYGQKDLKIKNTYPSNILIKCYIEKNVLTVDIWGL